MSKCSHGLTSRECLVCASPKYGAQPAQAGPVAWAFKDGERWQLFHTKDAADRWAERFGATVYPLVLAAAPEPRD